VAEIRNRASVTNDNRRPQLCRRLVHPVHASSAGIERIYSAIAAADKDPAPKDRRLCRGFGRSRKSERPLQLELRNALTSKTGRSGVLKAGIRTIRSPSIPGGRI